MLKIIKHIKVQVPVSKKNTNKIFHSHSPWSRSRQNRAAAILAQNAYGTLFFFYFSAGLSNKSSVEILKGTVNQDFYPPILFCWTNPSRPLFDVFLYFRIWLRFCNDIRMTSSIFFNWCAYCRRWSSRMVAGGSPGPRRGQAGPDRAASEAPTGSMVAR